MIRIYFQHTFYLEERDLNQFDMEVDATPASNKRCTDL